METQSNTCTTLHAARHMARRIFTAIGIVFVLLTALIITQVWRAYQDAATFTGF
jgi:hypothetical protein